MTIKKPVGKKGITGHSSGIWSVIQTGAGPTISLHWILFPTEMEKVKIVLSRLSCLRPLQERRWEAVVQIFNLIDHVNVHIVIIFCQRCG